MSEGENGAPSGAEKSSNASDAPPARKGVFFWLRRSGRGGNNAAPASPRPKRRREGALSAFSGLLSFLLVAFAGGVFALLSAHHLLNEPGPLRVDKTVLLPSGADTQEILAQLESEGVIENPTLLSLAMLIEGKRGLRSGEYLFKQHVTPNEVIDELINGRQVLHSVTIPEGLTSEQILQRLHENDVLAGELRDTPKEGALLPETYKVTRGYPRSKLIAKMQEDQRKLVDQIWQRRAKDLPFRTPYELVTLASIVEKETGKAEERPRVAAVFVNRLRKGMRLQSDPTIIYGLAGGKATLGHGITRAELEKYSPYNTYVIDGLPPGPIANPGRASLEAAANPLPTADLYFVADGTGGHVFASSLDQHNRNVQRWRQIEKEKANAPDVAPPDLAPPASPPPPRGQRGGALEILRFVAIDAGQEDYPKGRTMAADDGAAHRLGKFGPWAGMFAIGSLDDPTLEAAPRYDALRPARPYFTLAAARPRSKAPGFDPVASLPRLASGEEDDSADASSAADGGIYPLSEARRAELKARAAKLGLAPSSDRLPGGVIDAPDQPQAEAAAYAVGGSPTQPTQRRPKVIDASEGSAIDPLRDFSWDLRSPKTVPENLSLR